MDSYAGRHAQLAFLLGCLKPSTRPWGSASSAAKALDLVHKDGEACFEFVELKIDSDTPVFAAIEILVYGLLWLLSRRDRELLGYRSNPILEAKTLRLSVLAPRTYYSRCPVVPLSHAINEGLHTLGPRFGVSMNFRFTAFPAAFYWSSQPGDPRRARGPDLIDLLDGREDL